MIDIISQLRHLQKKSLDFEFAIYRHIAMLNLCPNRLDRLHLHHEPTPPRVSGCGYNLLDRPSRPYPIL